MAWPSGIAFKQQTTLKCWPNHWPSIRGNLTQIPRGRKRCSVVDAL